jgi:hypothetical protein
MSTPLTTPQPAPTASAVNTITIQWVSAAMVWVARVVAQTLDRATMAPTDRSMPPPPMTKVIPMLTTPMTEASRRMVIALAMLAKLSPAVMTPTMQSSSSAMTRPRLRPTEPAMIELARELGAEAGGSGAASPAARTGPSAEESLTPSGSGDFWVDPTLMPRLLS